MIKRHNLKLTAMALVIGTAIFTGCGSQTAVNVDTTGNTVTGITKTESVTVSAETDLQVSYADDDYYTEWEDTDYTAISLGNEISVEGEGAGVEGLTITISNAGTYVLSGALADGHIIVDTQSSETVRLVLNGVEINSSENSPVHIKNAEKVVISLAEGTSNSISDTENYIFAEGEDEPDAAIFSKADLTINGSGTLNVTANYGDAITSKDSLKIMEGNFVINAADDGIRGKDMVAIKDGDFTITSAGDGVKATNATDAGRGFILVEDGTFNINAEGDGFQAETDLHIIEGTYKITTGGGSVNGAVHVDSSKNGNKTFGTGTDMADKGSFAGGAGRPEVNRTPEIAGDTVTAPSKSPETPAAEDNTAAAESTAEDTVSTKAIKAALSINIDGGTFTVDSADDAIHSNETVIINGGTFNIKTGDDAVHADTYIEINNGQLNVEKCYEGIEGIEIVVNGGNIEIKSDDDGVNASDGSNTMAIPGSTDGSSVNLTVNGGYIFISAQGDGLDSNGSMNITGGTCVVNALIGKGENALDYDDSFQVTGGTFATTGGASLGSEQSTQNVVSMSFAAYQDADTLVAVLDESNNVVIAFAPDRSSNSVYMSSADLQTGEAYTLSYGGTISGEGTNGLYTSGTYSGGTLVTEFTIENQLTYINESGVTTSAPVSSNGGGGGKGGMGRGQMPAAMDTAPVTSAVPEVPTVS